jgi:pimeloyl-ACP methyl ester carboxylesterase
LPGSNLVDGTVVIVIHGLSANRKLMEPVAAVLAAQGFDTYSLDMPGHGDSPEPFSFQRAEQCAAEFVSALTTMREGEIPHQIFAPVRHVVLIGHSTGAGIAIRLADRFDADVTIAISPAPLTPQPGPFADATPFTLPHRLPANLLVFIASLDPYPIRDSAKEWTTRAGAPRDSDADFAARRALRLTDVPRSNHTSLLVDFSVGLEAVNWIHRALATGRSAKMVPSPPLTYLVALLGLFLLFPAAASLLLGRAHLDVSFSSASTPTASTPSAPAASATPLLVRNSYLLWLSASILAALLLRFWIPLHPLRLFSGDYLASFLFLVAFFALAACWRQSRAPLLPFLKSQISDFKSLSPTVTLTPLRSLSFSILLAFAFFLAASWLLAWQATDVWLNSARWLRFPWLLLPMFIYALAEELALGPPRPGRADVFRRLLRAIALRAILLIVMLAAILILRSNQILIPLIALYLGLFSLFQRLAADAIRRRASSALAAAVFSAILAAWYIAAVFPLL